MCRWFNSAPGHHLKIAKNNKLMTYPLPETTVFMSHMLLTVRLHFCGFQMGRKNSLQHICDTTFVFRKLWALNARPVLPC